MHNKAFPYIGVLSLFWGTNIVASRFGIGEFNPYLFITLRLSIATIFFLPILKLMGHRFPTDKRLWGHAALSGILGVMVPMTSFTVSLQYLSSGVASIFVTAAPALIVVAAHLALPDEKMTRNKVFGVILAMSGSIFLVLRGESGLAGVGRASPLGFILVMVGLISETVNAMLVRRRMVEMDPMTVTAIRLFVAGLMLFVITSLFGDFSFAAVTPSGVLSLAFAALLGALGGQFLAFYITRRFGATAFSLTSYLVPVVATTLGVVLLNEIVTWAMVVGVVLIGGGIFLINLRVYAAKRVFPL